MSHRRRWMSYCGTVAEVPPQVATAYTVTLSTTAPAAGATITAYAQLVDADGIPVRLAGVTVSWGATGGATPASQTSDTNADGRADASVTVSTTAGTAHVVSALDISGRTGTAPTATVVAGPMSLVRTYMVGGSIDLSGTIDVQVIECDQYGNHRTTSSGTPVISRTPEVGSLGSVTDSGGTHTATFTGPGEAATVTFSATFGGQAVGSGCTVYVGVYAAPTYLNIPDFTGATFNADRTRLYGPVGNAYELRDPWGRAQALLDVVDDPTGRYGKVAKFTWANITGDIALGWFPSPTFGYDTTVWFRGWFFCHRDAPDNTQIRKYVYWFSNNGALSVTNSTAGHSMGHQVYNPLPSPRLNDEAFTGPAISFDTWHYLELGMGMNSSGTANGWYKQYLDGVLVHELNNAQIIGPGSVAYNSLYFGYQVNDNAGNEWRLWSGIAFSDSRIGP